MAEVNMPLCIHSEATDPSIDIFDREASFVESTLKPLHADLPNLKIIMELLEYIKTRVLLQIYSYKRFSKT